MNTTRTSRRSKLIALGVPLLVLATGAAASGAAATGAAATGAAAGVAATGGTRSGVVGTRTAGPVIAALQPTDPIAIGMPDRTVRSAKRAGAVEIRGSRKILTANSLGFTATPGARFGASVTVMDVNHDRLKDLVIGVPGTATSVGGGAVVIALQSATLGFTAAGSRLLKVNSRTGDQFGAAVAVSYRSPNWSRNELWVGAPGRDLRTPSGRTITDAGVVYRYLVAVNGTITAKGVVSQNNPLIPGAAARNDRFGEVLEAGGNGVVVGVPRKDIGSAIDAGVVVRIHTDPDTNALLPAETVSQNSPDTPGTAASGDRFGAALAGSGAVGIPGEKVGSKPGAGAVQLYDTTSGLAWTPGLRVTQDSLGIPGIAETGDHFGSAIRYGLFNCDINQMLAVGAPGEDVGSQRDAGSVSLVPPILGFQGCFPRILTQADGLAGLPRAGNRVGAAITSAQGEISEDTTRDTLVIGAPGTDRGRATDAGQVIVWDASGAEFTVGFGHRLGDIKGLRFGSVVAAFG